jgi:NAD(P)H dehydrogenase (quinone)
MADTVPAFPSDQNGLSPRILIAFYSRGGSVEALAGAISEGAMAVGAEVRLRRAREVVSDSVMSAAPGWLESAQHMNDLYPAPELADAEWADALVLGSPTRFGSACSELRAYLETLGPLWVSGKLQNKVGSAFTSAGAIHGGVETTILSLFPAMAHLNLIIVPTGYGHPSISRAGTPYGAASVSFASERKLPNNLDLDVAKYQGERVARVAHAVRSLHHSPEFDS